MFKLQESSFNTRNVVTIIILHIKYNIVYIITNIKL